MITKRKLELLAPAKDKKTAAAAIESGADAVYVGSPKFGCLLYTSPSPRDA